MGSTQSSTHQRKREKVERLFRQNNRSNRSRSLDVRQEKPARPIGSSHSARYTKNRNVRSLDSTANVSSNLLSKEEMRLLELCWCKCSQKQIKKCSEDIFLDILHADEDLLVLFKLESCPWSKLKENDYFKSHAANLVIVLNQVICDLQENFKQTCEALQTLGEEHAALKSRGFQSMYWDIFTDCFERNHPPTFRRDCEKEAWSKLILFILGQMKLGYQKGLIEMKQQEQRLSVPQIYHNYELYRTSNGYSSNKQVYSPSRLYSIMLFDKVKSKNPINILRCQRPYFVIMNNATLQVSKYGIHFSLLQRLAGEVFISSLWVNGIYWLNDCELVVITQMKDQIKQTVFVASHSDHTFIYQYERSYKKIVLEYYPKYSSIRNIVTCNLNETEAKIADGETLAVKGLRAVLLSSFLAAISISLQEFHVKQVQVLGKEYIVWGAGDIFGNFLIYLFPKHPKSNMVEKKFVVALAALSSAIDQMDSDYSNFSLNPMPDFYHDGCLMYRISVRDATSRFPPLGSYVAIHLHKLEENSDARDYLPNNEDNISSLCCFSDLQSAYSEIVYDSENYLMSVRPRGGHHRLKIVDYKNLESRFLSFESKSSKDKLSMHPSGFLLHWFEKDGLTHYEKIILHSKPGTLAEICRRELLLNYKSDPLQFEGIDNFIFPGSRDFRDCPV